MKQIIVVGVTLVIAAAGLSACAGSGPGPMASAQSLQLPPDKFHGVMKPCSPKNLDDKRVCFDVIHD